MVQYSCQCRKDDAVVGDGYALLASAVDTAQYVFAVKHAGSAMDDEVVGGEVVGVVGSADNVDL